MTALLPIANGRPCYLFDIDGTLADLSHRLHHIQTEPKNWDAFFGAVFDDKPIQHICDLANILSDGDNEIVLVSGRSDQCRDDTVDWLTAYAINWRALYMRKAGDHRPDHIVKSEILDQVIAHGYAPIMAFDDRDQVVAMWRARGIPCAQVAPGAF